MQCRALGLGPIYVVDDGSDLESSHAVWAKIKALSDVRLLEQETNLGKGASLKNGFRKILAELPECLGIVTADADGQHLPTDIQKVAETLRQSPQALVIGARSFGASVPWRSQFGNRLTRTLFRALLRLNLQDTQSGLRGIARTFVPELLILKGCRYEFELEMLIQASVKKVPLQEISISTVYEPGNPTSHFRPLVDSYRIYSVFFGFLARKQLS